MKDYNKHQAKTVLAYVAAGLEPPKNIAPEQAQLFLRATRFELEENRSVNEASLDVITTDFQVISKQAAKLQVDEVIHPTITEKTLSILGGSIDAMRISLAGAISNQLRYRKSGDLHESYEGAQQAITRVLAKIEQQSRVVEREQLR